MSQKVWSQAGCLLPSVSQTARKSCRSGAAQHGLLVRQITAGVRPAGGPRILRTSRPQSHCFSSGSRSCLRQIPKLAASEPSQASPVQQPPKKPKRGRNIALFLLSAAAIVGIAGTGFDDQPGIPAPSSALLSRLLYGPALNPERFVPFTITAREQVSPTAFIITVRPKHAGAARSSALLGIGPAHHPNRAVVRAAWAHGLWAVEIKQPQLQVARDYTPLPPRQEGVEEEEELRFLIRRVRGGEVSSYLAGLGVGDDVELRGPHYGFDLAARMRLGQGGGEGGGGGAEARAVFLAGGTGIAPALQAVRVVLGGGGVVQAEDARGGSGRLPVVDIFWANRSRADCVGCGADGLVAAAATGEQDGKNAPGEPPLSGSIVDQLREMKAQYGDRFNVRCFVDEERSFIGAKGVAAALQPQAGEKKKKKSSQAVEACEADCRYHDERILEWTDTDSPMPDGEGVTCRCEGKNLAIVSGPEGFVQAFAGPKRWANGKELQGQVGGILGDLRRRYPDLMKDWLVLKL